MKVLLLWKRMGHDFLLLFAAVCPLQLESFRGFTYFQGVAMQMVCVVVFFLLFVEIAYIFCQPVIA